MKTASKLFAVILSLFVCLASCRHKPAYSEMDPDASRNGNAKAAASSPNAQQTAPENPQTASTPQPAFKRPSFMGADGGTIMDLPDYPRGRRQSVVMGPNQGTNMMSLALTTKDAMDQISPFYEQVIKRNRWTVADKIADPEYCEWSLKKGDNNMAKITIKKDAQTGLMTISILRAEKLEEPAK